MKKIAILSLMLAALPFVAMAQSNDDLYYIPKKKAEKKTVVTTPVKVVEQTQTPTTAVYASPGSTVVVKDVKGNIRDVDEYNRRYTSRENTFSMENDTLYIEEKPYNEQGEWVNGFEGSQSDYEYAMRIIRFRNPRYAIPVSSPLYWDVVYALPSWEWNVFDDGYYAYAFPTYSNRLWWDWRYNYSWGWGFGSPWYYSSWYTPGYWYGGWWGGHWGGHWGHIHHHHHPHHGPMYAGVGGYWGNRHGWNGSSARNPGIHAGRYNSGYRTGYAQGGSSSSRRVTGNTVRNSRNSYVGSRQNTTRNGQSGYRTGERVSRNSSGRVVTSKDASSSVRPQRSAVRTRTNGTVSNRETTGVRSGNTYTRPTQSRGSAYNRQSSTRSTVTNTGSGTSYQRRSGASERGAYRSSSSSRSSESRSSYQSSRSSSSSRSSYSSGSSSSRSSAGGGASRSGGGGGSRGGGGGRR